MKLGVLIIGSLYWDDKPHRNKWRRERLCVDSQQHVKAPIRYGRLSHSRGCSYTMVFSASLSEEQFGQAIVVPFKSKDLISEAECLWTAERPPNKKPNGRISADWGRVALVENPEPPNSGRTARSLDKACLLRTVLRTVNRLRVQRENCGQSDWIPQHPVAELGRRFGSDHQCTTCDRDESDNCWWELSIGSTNRECMGHSRRQETCQLLPQEQDTRDQDVPGCRNRGAAERP